MDRMKGSGVTEGERRKAEGMDRRYGDHETNGWKKKLKSNAFHPCSRPPMAAYLDVSRADSATSLAMAIFCS